MSHTPGPWHIDGIFDIRDSQNRKICSITAVGQAIEEVKANAILIKTAPDLLEALKKIEWIHLQDYSDWIYEGIVCPWCYGFKEDGHKENCQRQQAITRAEGKSP